jgi:sugar phosphate isomerase/epimerase
MKTILDSNGIKHVELEFLLDWWRDDERKKEADKRQKFLFNAAEALGARSVKVGDFFAEQVPMGKLIESFAAVCEDAARHGTKIGYELMPEQFSMIHSIPSAKALIEGAGAKNGGIFFDLWHIVKQKIPYDEVARFPVRNIIGIELNDGYLKTMPDLAEETTQHRQLCGEGEFDVKGFVARMLKTGFAGPWGIEVLNKELRYRPIGEVTRRAYETTIAQFESQGARAAAR